jgi:S-adenosylmethionine hydrolase
LEPVAPTFHGRDVFAPVAAHLAAGGSLAVTGEPIDPASLVRLELPEPRLDGDALVAHVLYADRFGNLILDAVAAPPSPADVRERRPGDGFLVPRFESGARLSIAAAAGEFDAVRGSTFADGAGGLVVYDDSSGRLGLALDGGSAADLLGAGRDDELRIESQ